MKQCLDCGNPIAYQAMRCVFCAKVYARWQQRLWRAQNKERLRLYRIMYRPIKNAARLLKRDHYREYEKQVRKEYPEIHRAKKAKRRASRKNATPSWVDHTAIQKIYKRAAQLNKHVDHIVPLQHPLVCGLHVPWNLQLLTPRENHRKRNTFNSA